MGENIAIIIIFFIMLVFGMAFYSKVQKGSSDVRQTEAYDIKAVEIAQKTSYLPELRCSSKNVQVEDCFDVYKLDVIFNNNLFVSNIEYYYDLFERSTISINETYPDKREWRLYDRSNENMSKISTKIPLSLYNASDESYSLGVLYVDLYYGGI